MKTTTEQPTCKWNLQWFVNLICTTLTGTLLFKPILRLCRVNNFRGSFLKLFVLTILTGATVNVALGQSCEGLFTISAAKSYDPILNKTTYTYTVTKTGAKNALSHWGFPIDVCEGQEATLEHILIGYVAETSLDQINWAPASSKYGQDPSQSCMTGALFKFDVGMNNETTRYFRLILNGNWTLIPEIAYIKYGNNCCVLPVAGGCLDEACIPPLCSITGLSGVCPSSTNLYSGPNVNGVQYEWAITAGTATIVGPNNGPTVQVMAGATCGSYNLRLTSTKSANCITICNESFTISDNGAPVFTGSYVDVNLACNPANPAGSLGTATATDACGAVTITSQDASVVSDGCSRSQTRTFTAKDACNNTASASRTVRWIVDINGPVFTGNYADVNLTCNVSEWIGSLGSATATDGCGGAVTITQSDGAVQSTDCNRSITRTFTARDACNNTATVSRTVRWKAVLSNINLTVGGLSAAGEFDLGCNPSEPSIEAQLGTANAENGCATVSLTTTTAPTATTNNACERVRVRTFSATDDCGHIVTAARIVRWIISNSGPQINPNTAPTALGCNPSENDINAALGTITATDVCANVTITPSDGATISTGCSRERTRTWTATGGCGNTASASRTVTWTADVAAPVFTGSYTDVNLNCNPENPNGSLGTATATDGCGPVTITSSDGDVQSDGCARWRIRTFTARDGCNNTATTSRTVRWTTDVAPPVFTGSYTDVNLNCNPENPNGSLGTATATDGCGPVTITSSDGDVQSNGCARWRIRTFTARDGCNNTATTSRTVRWTADVAPPAFTGSYTDVNLNCNPENPNGSLGTATATDGCGPVTITSSDGDVQSNGCARWRIRTFTARDGCNNTATTSRTVRWTADVAPPAFTGSYTDVNLNCNPTADPNGSLGTATATDGCGPVTITSSDGDVQSDGCARWRIRTFTARDGCNNTATTSRTVRWTADVAPPAFTGSYTDVNLNCNPENPNGSLGTATATDGCGPVTISSSDGDVQSDGCARWRIRTFTARDGCNNTATTSRTVRWTADVAPPAFTGSYTDVNLNCNPENPNGSLGTATATDGCGPVTITSSDGDVQSNGCARWRIRTFTARDGCNNTATTSRTVRWTADVAPPAFTGGYTDVNLNCNPENPNGSLGTATATDGCGPVTITSSDGDVQSNGCARWRIRTFTARDGCNNTATTSRTVRWTADVAPPAFTGSYTDVNLNCNPENPNGSLGTATATDGCGPVTITSSDGDVQSNGCARWRIRTFTARDGCNNTATTSRTVRWTADVAPPAFTGSYTDVNLACNPENPNGSLGSATATDGCGPVTITSSDGDVQSNGCARWRIRTFIATDGCLNTATTSRTVRWTADNTPPVISTGGTTTSLGCNPSASDINAALGTATATDGCGTVSVTGQGSLPGGSCVASYKGNNGGGNCPDKNGFGPTGTITLNFGSSFTVAPIVLSVTDNDPLSDLSNVLFGPGVSSSDGLSAEYCYYDGPNNNNNLFGGGVILTFNLQFSAGEGCTEQTPVTPGTTAIPTASDSPVVSDGCSRSQTRTWTASDACGNTATASRTVTWKVDVTPPAFTGSYADVNLNCNPENPNGSLGTATATDGCGPVTITSSDGDVQSDGCARWRIRTFTARDGCNNTATTSRTVRWTTDVAPPAFTGSYTDVNLNCNPENPNGSLGTATATDGCGPVTITSSDGDVQSNGCARWRIRTFTARDGCNNTATTSRTVRWTADVAPPAFTGSYTDVNLNCNPENPNGSLGTATATDGCGPVTITSSDGDVQSDGCARWRIRTFTARDGCNNTATTSRTVRWTADVAPPAFTGSYTDVNLNCNPENPNGSLGTATATDGCGPVTITSSDGDVQSNGCARWRIRTFTARDGCNNTATTSRTVRWTADVAPPAFTGSYTDVNLNCNPENPNGSLGTATATDGCGPVTITSSDGDVQSDGCARWRIRTFTARDGCNNTATTSRTVRWTADVAPPAFTGSYTDVNLNCNPENPNGSLGTATATDGCGPVTITSSDGDVQSNGCARWRIRTFTARDGCNNTATTSRTVRWTADVAPPAFTGSYTDVNLACNPENPNGSLGSATATDGCGPVTITSSDGDVQSNGCARWRIRTFIATDGCLNTATTSRTVRWTADNTPPVISTGGTTTSLGCNPSASDINAALGTATATDGCGTVSVTGQGSLPGGSCVASYKGNNGGGNCPDKNGFGPTGTITLNFGSSFTVAPIVLSVTDNDPLSDLSNVLFGPGVSSSDGLSAEYCYYDGPNNNNNLFGGGVILTFNLQFSAGEGCTEQTPVTPGTTAIPTASDSPVVSDGCSRSQTRTWTASDACGNTATASRTVTWKVDVTPPAFTGSYADVNLNCNPENPNGSLGTATATDGCGPVTITSSDGDVQSDGCARWRIRTFTARDGCNNTATTSRTVRWTTDVAPPAFTGNYTDVNLNCNPENPNGSLGTATATDGCGPVTITSSDGDVQSNGCARWRIRTFTARDGCNNTATTSRTVRWTADVAPPAFTGSYTDVNLNCNPENPNGSLGTATATDGCGPVTITSSDGDVQSNGCARWRIRTFTARDGCNNTATTSRTVRWTADVAPPAFTGSYTDVNLNCNPENPNGSLGTATATDGCGPVTITSSDGDVQSNGCARWRIRTFTARDGCNNTATTSRTVRWTADVAPPAFTGSYTDVNLNCNPENPNGSLGTATATDGCGPVTITSSDGDVQSNGCARWRIRTFTARDGCNNTATTSRTVRWTADVAPPAFTGSYTDVNLNCNPENPNGSLGTATATDGCGPVTITSSDGDVQSNGCARWRIRTFTARDGCNNTATTSRTVRWTADVAPPAFTGSYTDVNLNCNPENPNGSLGTATATDGCGPVTITSSDGDVQSNGCARWRIRTFTARDGCNNTATTSRTVRWTADVAPPAFTGSYTDVNLNCNPENPNGSLGTATATDGCGPVTITSSDGDVQSNGCARWRIRTFTARDGCNNTATTSRTVRWTADVAPPAFTGSYTDVNLNCNPENPNGSLGTATATDGCGPVTITSSDGDVQSNGCARWRIRTFTARDGCNNTATTSRTVRWTADVAPPAFTGSYTDVNLNCNPENPNGSLGTATATDGCGPVTITSSDGDVQSNGCARWRIRTFTARDGCNNTATTSRTVRWTADVAPPAFTGSYTDVNLNCNPENPNGSLGTATATDGCGPVTITSSDGDVQSNGCARWRIRTFTARDGCNNTATTSRTVRWTVDRTAPVFTTTPANVDVDCTAPVPSSVTPTASDACGTPTVTMTGSTDNPANCTTGFKRIITRTWTAQDACGNTATYTQTIRVRCCLTVCTLTQGAYGNAGGNICLPNGTTVNQTQIMINALTAAPGNMKVFGRQDLNRYWVVRLSDVNQGSNSNIFKMLPGGGPSGIFGLDVVAGVPEYSNAPSWPVVPLQGGKIRNQLFSQTLTLYFNTTIVGISGNTIADVLLNGSLAMIAPRNCGSSDPAGPGVPTQLVSPAVSSYLATHGYATTVGGLLQLANDALGGVNVSPLTLSQIQGAVDGINNIFDECKILTGYVPAGGDAGRVIASNSISSEPSLTVTAFPNPYEENFSLKINSPVTGQAAISFYTMDGVKIGEMKRDVVAKKDVSVPYNVPAVYRTRIVYTVTVGSYTAKGIVLSPN